MLSNIIYCRDAKGSIRTWQGQAVEGQWRSQTGLLGGNLILSEWTKCEPRSQPTAKHQAEFEMQAQFKKLLAKDYRMSEALVDVPRGSFIKPMLAKKYSGYTEPCWIQPKLDGMRCLANVDNLWSRGAKIIPGAPHIHQSLTDFFSKHPNVVLDGELYNHDYHDDFNGLMSVAKTGAKSDEEREAAAKIIQYWIYDCFFIDNPSASLKDRFRLIERLASNWDQIQIVGNYPCNSAEVIEKHHIMFVQAGYEGSIIRLDRPYEQKRSNTLLKNKNWFTEEFELLRIEEGKGNWSGYAKRAVCKVSEEVECGAGIKGNQTFCRELLSRSPTEFESVTIRHFGKTPDGSLRFPIAVAFNERGGLEDRAPRKSDLDANDTSEDF